MTHRQNNAVFVVGMAVLLLACVAIWNAPRPPLAPVPDPLNDDAPDFAALITEDYTPPELLGLPDDHCEVAAEVYAEFPEAFQVTAPEAAAENAKKNVRLWEIARKVELVGKPLGTDYVPIPQQTGDCTSQASTVAKTYRLAIQEFKGESDGAGVAYPCYDYGIGRVHADKQAWQRIPCGRGGSYPAIVCPAAKVWGFLSATNDPPPYSGRTAIDWGCRGVPEKYLAAGKMHAGGDAYPIRSIDEAIEAMVNLYPLVIGVPFAPGRKYVADGRNCIQFGSSGGGHAMAVIGFDGSAGEGYFYIQNSHGAKAQAATDPLQGEPLGGFWVPRSQMERWLDDRRRCEVWAISDVAGFPAEDEIDWSVFGPFDVPQPQMKETEDESENDRAAAGRRSFAVAL